MRRVLITFVVAIAIVFVALLVIVLRKPSRVVTLPNGMRVELLGTAVGGATFRSEKPWERMARKVLPPRWQNWIPPASIGSCGGGTNSLTIFVRVTDPTGAPINLTPWSGYTTEDETGFRYQRGGGYCGWGVGSGSVVYGLTLVAFPRRQPSFWFHFLDSSESTIASFNVPNPVQGPFPAWQPAALRQTQTNGPVILTLEGLREIGDKTVMPQWTKRATNPAWIHSRVGHTSFADATGNESLGLSRREPAWKMRTVVYRERSQDFSDAERLVLTNLAVPQPGTFIAIDQTVERVGVRLNVQVLSGPGELSISNGVQRTILPPSQASSGHSTSSSTTSSGTTRVETWGSQTPFFLVEVQGALPDDEIRFRLRDEAGGEIKFDESSGYNGSSSGKRIYQRRFNPPPNTKSLNLELIVNRPLAFEFMVNPADVLPAKR